MRPLPSAGGLIWFLKNSPKRLWVRNAGGYYPLYATSAACQLPRVCHMYHLVPVAAVGRHLPRPLTGWSKVRGSPIEVLEADVARCDWWIQLQTASGYEVQRIENKAKTVYEVVSTRNDPEAHVATSHGWIQLAVTSVRIGNEFVYNPNPYSYNKTPNFFNQPPQPQYETYSCKLCGNDSHYGFDCPSRVPLNFKVISKESTIPLNKTPQISLVNAITHDLLIKEPEDSLIMGNEELSTIPEKESAEFIKSSVEDLIPILRESEDSSGSDSESVLPSSDDFSPIVEEKSMTFSNPLFEFNDQYIFNDVSSLFDEVLENIESKDSYVSNLDGPTLLVTPLSDANEDECFDPEGVIDEIDAFYHDPRSLKDEPDNDDLMTEDKVFDPGIYEKSFSPTFVKLTFEDRL
ncbi:hypothetical protein Tco_0774241 [Tanacetum coccineum]|uniref:CCHC-type domain-containing protein n=1 Tax=Tanacetum coccineum TaxID=301880 RepID=A0ABQ4ZN17_9ASTR